MDARIRHLLGQIDPTALDLRTWNLPLLDRASTGAVALVRRCTCWASSWPGGWGAGACIGAPAGSTSRRFGDLMFYGMLGRGAGRGSATSLFYGFQRSPPRRRSSKVWEGGMSFHGGLLGCWCGRVSGRASTACASTWSISSPRWCRGPRLPAVRRTGSAAELCGANRPRRTAFDGWGVVFPARPQPFASMDATQSGRSSARACAGYLRAIASQLYPGLAGGVAMFAAGLVFAKPRPPLPRCRACSRCCSGVPASWSSSSPCRMKATAFGWVTMGQMLSAVDLPRLFWLWKSRTSPP